MQPPTSNFLRSDLQGSTSQDPFIPHSSPGSSRKRSNSEGKSTLFSNLKPIPNRGPSSNISFVASEKESNSIVKSSPSSKAAQVSKRRRASRSYSVVIHDFSSSDETIYSEQGYETVVLCSVDDSDHSDDSNLSTDVPDNANQAEEEFTEFEIDTDSDHNNQDEDGADSAEDSDIEVRAITLANLPYPGTDKDFWRPILSSRSIFSSTVYIFLLNVTWSKYRALSEKSEIHITVMWVILSHDS